MEGVSWIMEHEKKEKCVETFELAQGGKEDAVGVAALVAQLVDLARDELVEPLQLADAVDDVLHRVGELGRARQVPLGALDAGRRRGAVHRLATRLARRLAAAAGRRLRLVALEDHGREDLLDREKKKTIRTSFQTQRS